MKIRKITAFIVAVLSVFVTLTTLPKVSKVSADTPATSVTFVQGFTYSFDYIVSNLFNAPEAVEGEEEPDDTKVTEIKYGTNGVIASASKHIFSVAAGTYEFKLFNGETEITDTSYYAVSSFKVITSAEAKDLSSISYVLNKKDDGSFDTSAFEAYKAKLSLDGKKLNDTLQFPDLNDSIVSFTYYNFADLKNVLSTKIVTLYYCKPNSETYTSTTGSSITLSHVGTYSFYFEVSDSFGKSLTIDTEVLVAKELNGVYGWYNENETEAEDDDTFVAPIFTFEFFENKNPEVTIAKQDDVERGFLNLAYNDLDDYVTVVGNNAKTKYELWYYASANAQTGLETTVTGDWTSAGVELFNDENTSVQNITEVEEFEFNSSTLSFVPTKAGHYYLVVRVADNYGTDAAVCYGVAVHEEFKTAKYQSEFFKNNWLSFMFLGIALLSLVGIILIIFIKPKEEAEEEVSVVDKK